MTSLNQLWLGLDGRYERGSGVSVSGCVCRGGGLVGWGCVRGVMVASCFSFAVVDGVAASLGSCGSFAGVRSLLALASCTPLVARVHHGAWGRVVTPLRPAAWERGLQAHPDREFAAYVCAGIREGFRVGFCYATARCVPARGNMSSVGEHSDVVIKYIQDERVLGRVLGPFRREDFPEVQVSPFGVIPKSEPGKWRLILDLSSPIGLSVNAGISKEWSSIACITVDVVTAQVVRAGRGALMAKFDLKSAYRNVPVHPDDRWLLGMSLDGALYVDVALPFGLRSAPKFFYAVADALTFMIQQKGVRWLEHYFDDFVLVGPPRSPQCGRDLQVALDVCADVGMPVAAPKTVGPTTVLPLLGIEVDSEALEVRLPRGKLDKLRGLVRRWKHRKCCTKRELQSLAGSLNNACKVVRPGRRFLRGFFSLLSAFGPASHFIRLNAAFRGDLEWWDVFLESWNGVSLVLQDSLLSPAVEFWSDASGS